MRDDWMMGSLADQSGYTPTNEELNRLRNPPMPRVPVFPPTPPTPKQRLDDYMLFKPSYSEGQTIPHKGFGPDERDVLPGHPTDPVYRNDEPVLYDPEVEEYVQHGGGRHGVFGVERFSPEDSQELAPGPEIMLAGGVPPFKPPVPRAEDASPGWLMGSLAAQDAYRGDYPDWARGSHEAEGPPREAAGPPTQWEMGRRVATGEAPIPQGAARGQMGSLAALGTAGQTIEDVGRTIPSATARGLMSGIASMGVPNDPMLWGDQAEEQDVRGRLGAVEAQRQVNEHLYHPKTLPGQFANSVFEVGGNPINWVGPGSMAMKAGFNVASGLGGELGAQAYKDTPYERVARLAGSFAPLGLERGWAATEPALKYIPEGAGVIGGRLKQPQPKMGELADLTTYAPPASPAPWLDPTIARQIQRTTRTEGGSTTNVNTGENPTSGLMMGIYKNADPRAFNTPDRLSQADLEKFVQTNRNALGVESRSDLVGPRRPGDRYLGTWRDPDTGVAYLDVSQRFDPDQIRQATKFGERTGQLAGWDVGAKAAIPVGNWPDYITQPAFHQRMHEMADVGQRYLSQHPTREWWTNEPFARVYGQERMPHVAGYTAATAPNAAPRENLQTMSEYARRHIRGESIIQPEWRVPEGMMTRSPGAMIGMEQSRVLNLDRAFRGATSELQRQKVREEARALLGDEGAVVLDRHWARLAEDPALGVYANTQEGVISSAPRKGLTDYDLLKTEVTKAAQVAGRTPNGFSADVWTGIRDTIQKTSELYGQKFRGSAITGESKSYADHFEDLIRDKAQHLGITTGEMEKRLRSGDANLMSWVVATTPAAWQAYRQYQAQTGASSSDQKKPNTGAPQNARDEL